MRPPKPRNGSLTSRENPQHEIEMQPRHHSVEVHERKGADDKSLSASSEDQLLASPTRAIPLPVPDIQTNYSVTSNHNNNSTVLKEREHVVGETHEANSDSSVHASGTLESNLPSSPLQNSLPAKKGGALDAPIQEEDVEANGKDNKDAESNKEEVRLPL